jgi:hypothetical protein
MNLSQSHNVGIFTACVFLMMVFLGAYAAYCDQFLFVSQMKEKGFSKGLPFIVHLGMLGDIALSFLLGFIVWKYGSQWHASQCLVAAIVGIIASIAMHFMYVSGGLKIPESHTYGGYLTKAGWIHVVYMAAALMILIQFYFFTPNIDPFSLKCVGLLLAVHILLGTHLVLGFILKVFPVSWVGKDYLSDIGAWVTVLVIWGTIALRSFFILRLN